jgi:hypothetical protein
MNFSRKVAAALFGAGMLALSVAPVSGATRRIPPLWKNCTHVNGTYRHGVGKLHAHDHTSGTGTPVTNFRRSTRLYNIAMTWNKRLDADRDGIACEKH